MLRHAAALVVMVGCSHEPVPSDAAPPAAQLDARCQGAAGRPRVLVYSRETLWMHPSTPVAQQSLVDMCQTRGFSVVASHDPLVFDRYLAQSDVVVFAVTSGLVLDTQDRRDRLETWLRDGHGLVGIHSASATESDWPFFAEAIGGAFNGHYPGLVAGTLTSVDPDHPISAGYPIMQSRADEWYSFTPNPGAQAGTHVLFTLDESTMPPDYPAQLRMGVHPIAWTHEGYGGRTFYTALGHVPDSYQDPRFLDVLAHGIEYAAGR